MGMDLRMGSALRERLHSDSVHTHRLDVQGIDTYVLEAGQGPPLILLHGGIESGGAYWEPVIAGLAESYHVVAPDVPGLGESPAAERLDTQLFNRWFTALVERTCRQPPTVLAHSLLGTLAARFAIAHGHLLRHLVIWSAPGVGRYRMPAGLAASAVMLGMWPSERSLTRFARWPFHDLDGSRRRDPAWFELFFSYTLACARRAETKRTMRHLIGTCTRRISVPELRSISVPATLLWGEHDRMVPIHLAEAATTEVGWPLRIMPNAGHVPQLEQPDQFLATVLDVVGGHGRQ
jgi:2-hydroxymuconate-semialdehyde hydrolase